MIPVIIIRILLVVAPVFTIIAIGFGIQKLRPLKVQSISNLVVDILVPCLVFSSIVNSSSNANEWLGVTLVAGASTFALMGLSWMMASVLEVENRSKTALILSASFGNTGNYGLPLVFFALGAEGLQLAVVFFVVSFMLMFTVGVLIASSETRSFVQSVKSIARLPLIYALLAAVAVKLTGLPVPLFVLQGLNIMSQVAIGSMLIVLGLELARCGFDRSNWKLVSLASLIKLLFPMLIISSLSLFGLQKLPFKVELLQASMPTAILVLLITVKFGGNSQIATNTILITTLASVVTLPILMSLLL